MKGFRLAGVLWLVAAVFAVVITVVFRINPLQWVVTIAAGAVGVIIGFLLIARPGAAIVRWSSGTGVAWLIIYAALTVQQSGELVAWATDVFIAALGVAAAILTYRAAGATNREGPAS